MKKNNSGFWQDSLHAMHPSVRIRYIPYFAMAESMDNSFDALLGLWKSANDGVLQAWRALVR